MSTFDLIIYVLKFFIPSLFSLLFRAYGLGHHSKKRLMLGIFCYTTYMAVVPSTLILLMGYGQFTHIAWIVMTLSGLSVLIFSSDTALKTIFLHLVQGGMVTALSVVLNMLRHICGLSYEILVVMLLVTSPVLYIVALRFWAKPLRFLADNIHSNILTLTVIPILNMVMVYFLPVFPKQNFANYPIFCTFMMLAVEFGFFLYLYTFYRNLLQISLLFQREYALREENLTMKNDAQLLHLAADNMAQRLNLMDEVARNNNRSAHDRRHFNNMLLELLKSGYEQTVVDLLQTQNADVSKTSRIYCENPAVNAAVSHYAALAERSDIRTKIELDIPNDLVADALELSMVVSNLLENAVQACQRLPADREKSITFVCQSVGRLLLEMENPCTDDTVLDENGCPLPREEGHGIGSKSVLAFAKKHGGEVIYSIQNETFRVRLLF